MPYYNIGPGGLELRGITTRLEATLKGSPGIKSPTLGHTDLSDEELTRLKATLIER